jgi:hypothetical protein
MNQGDDGENGATGKRLAGFGIASTNQDHREIAIANRGHESMQSEGGEEEGHKPLGK